MRQTALRLAAAPSVALLFAGGLAVASNPTVTGTVFLAANFGESITSGVIDTYSIPAAIGRTLTYSAGTGSNQVDTIYAKKLTLAGAATTLDLTSVTDPSGATVNFARVREIIVVNTSTTAGNDCKVEQGSANGVSWLNPQSAPGYARYGGLYQVSDPLSSGSGNGNVITGTSKTITLDPGANTIDVNVLIVGGSAALTPAVVLLFLRRGRPAVARLRAA